MKVIFFILLMFGLVIPMQSISQNVGIGTTTPHTGSILDLGTSLPLLLPRLTSDQMATASPVTPGQIIYNTTEHRLYGYTRYRTSPVIGYGNNRWEPISFGPPMLAWGSVDSFTNIQAGSENFSVYWNSTEHWYEIDLLSPHDYYADSMVLIVTAVGNQSWDVAIATSEVVSNHRANIKFIDLSRAAACVVSGVYDQYYVRRRSNFHFVIYDLRKKPY